MKCEETMRTVWLVGLILVLGLALPAAPVSKAANQQSGAADKSLLAPAPPMGFNTWNKFGCDVSERLIREIADAMVSSGMREAGYRYLVIDDCWQVARAEDGRIIADPERFPSGMKALADYVHDKGLAFGLYTDVGPKTCVGRPGSFGFEDLDVATYAEWGVDYIKVDWCHADDLDPRVQYTKFREAIRKTGRPIVLSICEWGRNDPWKWAQGIGQLWRVTADIQDTWESIVWIVNANSRHFGAAGPGRWNDPDMLEVGNGGMTFDEYKAHFSLWAMMAAPLLAGNDVRDMTEETKEILLNREVIAVDQDPLGLQGRVVIDRGYGGQVWMKPLADGSVAVAFLNLTSKELELYVRWSQIGLPPGPAEVRDLWAHRDLGLHADWGRHFDERFKAMVPPHGVVMVRIRKASS